MNAHKICERAGWKLSFALCLSVSFFPLYPSLPLWWPASAYVFQLTCVTEAHFKQRTWKDSCNSCAHTGTKTDGNSHLLKHSYQTVPYCPQPARIIPSHLLNNSWKVNLEMEEMFSVSCCLRLVDNRGTLPPLHENVTFQPQLNTVNAAV